MALSAPTNQDDILAIPSPELQGFGYFQNVGSTRRQGIEAQVNLTSKTLQLYASYALVDARFLDALKVGSNSPFADAEGNVQILPGNRIPAIPRNRVKAGFDYSITDAFKVGGDALFVGSQYFVGDESNQAPRLPSYAVFKLHSSYQIDKTFQIYARADNIFDNRYATFGSFFETDASPISPMAARHSPTPFAQPGAAALHLRRPEGHVLRLQRQGSCRAESAGRSNRHGRSTPGDRAGKPQHDDEDHSRPGWPDVARPHPP